MTHARPTHRSPRKKHLGVTIASAATALAVIATAVFTSVTGVSATPVGYNLGTASSYAILAGTALTSNGINTLAGTGGTDIGVYPSATMTALDPSIQGHGDINLGNLAAAAAQADAAAAYLALKAAGPVTYIPGELGGTILPPGIYKPDVLLAAITMNTSFTLDGGGDPDAVWVFTTDAAASTAAGITMNLVNGAQAGNVYWAVGAAFSTGAGATVAGHFLAAGAISLGAAATINGQLIGLALAPVTISAGAVITNDSSVAAPSTVWVDETLAPIRSGVEYSDGVSVTTSDSSLFLPSAVTFAIDSGALPAGLTLNSATGVISGTATGTGTASWSISARILGFSLVTKLFTVTVKPGVQPYVDLGSAGTHVIIGQSNVTNVGVTNLSGDLGTDVAVGIGPITLGGALNGVGTTNVNNSAYLAAHNDLVAAITYAKSLIATPIGAELAAVTLTPGVYEQAAAIGFTGNLTLDAMGNPDGVFIIRTPAALVTAESATVTLTNGAQACNVYWVVGAAVTLGASNNFSGHIMATVGAVIGNNTVVNGQVMTANMAAVLSNSTIINNGCAPSGTFTIDGGATASTNDSTPTITGTSSADVGSPVTVTVGGQTLSTTVTAAGTWSVTAATLTGTSFEVAASVRNLAGGSNNATQTLTVDTTAPTLAIDGGSAAATGDTTPTISGTSDAIGRTVTVTVSGQTLTAVVAADGTWSETATTLTAAAHTVSATVTNTLGNRTTVNQTLTVDLTAPTLAINGGSARITGDTTPTISGTSDAIGRTVSVTVSGQTLTATVAADGTWSVATAALIADAHTVIATVSDPVGNATTITQTLSVDLTAPTLTITGGPAVITKDSTPTITGTSDAIGQTVTVTVSGQTITAVVAADGTWSVTAATLSDVDHTVSASVADSVGNTATTTQQLLVDTTAPVLTIDGGASVTTADTTPLISGTSDAIGRTVTVTSGAATRTAVVGADGVWSTTLPAQTAGAHTVTATVSDTAGNSATATQTVTVDSSVPLLTLNGGASKATSDTTPTISGTSDEIGGTVTVVLDSGEAGVQTLTALVASDGTWSVQSGTVAEGVHTVTASVTDTASTTVTVNQTLTVDTTAPTFTINGGAVATTADATPTISGTSDAIGRTVAVTVAGQTLTAVVTAGGTWSVIAEPLTAVEHTVTGTVMDLAGNTSTATQTLTVDLSAPTLSIDGGPDASTATANPVITGVSSAIGYTVTVTIDGQTLTAVVSEAGLWSVEAAAIKRGSYGITATVTDAGERTVNAYQTLDYLSVRPAIIHNTTKAQTLQQGDGDPITVTGNGFVAGETVEIWLHSTPVMLGTLTANSAGFIDGIVNDTKTTPLGIHHIVLTGLDSGASANSFDITVVAHATASLLAVTGFNSPWAHLLVALLLMSGSILLVAARIRRGPGKSRP